MKERREYRRGDDKEGGRENTKKRKYTDKERDNVRKDYKKRKYAIMRERLK